MQPRDRFSLGLVTEEKFGYCRAVRVGDRVWVSGTTALQNAGGVLPAQRGDAYAQGMECFARIGQALAHFGLGMQHIVAVRAFVTAAEHMPGFLRAHAEALRDVRPASTAVGTPFLVHPDLLVEIEAEAVG